MSGKVLIDTCGWIDFLRSSKGALGDLVEQALNDDNALLCGVIISELLQGAKGDKEKQQLEFLFSNVESLAVQEIDWLAAGQMLQALRGRGITLPLTDALIAVVANRSGVPVLTVDTHFQHLSVRLVDV